MFDTRVILVLQEEKMTPEETNMAYEELDALSLEYKRDYGTARRNIDVSNFINNPNAQGIVSVFGPGFSEKLSDLVGVEVCVLPDD